MKKNQLDLRLLFRDCVLCYYVGVCSLGRGIHVHYVYVYICMYIAYDMHFSVPTVVNHKPCWYTYSMTHFKGLLLKFNTTG